MTRIKTLTNVAQEPPESRIEKRGPKVEQRDEEPVPHTLAGLRCSRTSPSTECPLSVPGTRKGQGLAI
jgi:hypothetical protein